MRRSLVLAAALVALTAQPVLAWDPGVNKLDPGQQDEPDPIPLVVPEGIYLVTDVYAGDTVSRDGPTTTYSTVTVHETPGTYARVLETVGTGERSNLDGSSFNGRASMPDGRAVAGTYYEDYVLTPQGFISVNIVFFQDDSLTTAGETTRPPTTHDASPQPPLTDGTTVIHVREERQPIQPRLPSVEPQERSEDARAATGGVSLSPNGPVLSAIEVLRGRAVSLWPRAFVDGRGVAVRSWRLVAGRPDLVSVTSGVAADPCVATWLVLAPAGSSFEVRFEVLTDAAPGRTIVAAVAVDVRSPALLQ